MLSRAMFLWAGGIIRTAAIRKLRMDDLWHLGPEDSLEVNKSRFDRLWAAENDRGRAGGVASSGLGRM